MGDTEPRNAGTLDYLRRLGESGFWGSITLKIENGVVVHIKKEENIKPSSLSELPREYANRTHDR
jgi:hypothetical protein